MLPISVVPRASVSLIAGMCDLPLLGNDDTAAERDELWIGQRGLLAHKDRAGMRRDHRAQEFGIAEAISARRLRSPE